MIKKLLSITLIFAITTLTSGCEEKNTGPKTTNLVPAGEKVQIQLWTTQEDEFFKALGKEFLSELNNFNIQFKVVNFKDSQTLHTFLTSKMAENNGPDLVFTEGDWIAQNKNKFIAVGNSDSFSVENFRNNFVRAASDILTTDSTILGIPLGIDSLATIFNDEHIVDRLPGKNTPSKTWKELKTDVEHLTTTDNSFDRFASSGISLGRADNIHYSYEIAENMLAQMNTTFFDKHDGGARFHKSSGISSNGRQENYLIKTLLYFSSFASIKHKNNSWNNILADKNSENKNFETFAKGDTSIVFGYARDRQKIIDIAKKLKKQGKNNINSKNIRVSYLPQINDPKTNPDKRVIGKVYTLVVPQTAKYPKLSWKFLKFAAKKENIKSFGDVTQLPTSRVDLLLEQENTPHLGIYARQAKFARTNTFPVIKKSIFKTQFNEVLNKIQENNNITKLVNQWGQQTNLDLTNHWQQEKEMKRPVNKKSSPPQ